MSALLLQAGKRAGLLIASAAILMVQPYLVDAQSKTKINKAPDVTGATATDVKPEAMGHPVTKKKKKSHKKKSHIITHPSDNDKKLKEIKEEKDKEKNQHP